MRYGAVITPVCHIHTLIMSRSLAITSPLLPAGHTHGVGRQYGTAYVTAVGCHRGNVANSLTYWLLLRCLHVARCWRWRNTFNEETARRRVSARIHGFTDALPFVCYWFARLPRHLAVAAVIVYLACRGGCATLAKAAHNEALVV